MASLNSASTTVPSTSVILAALKARLAAISWQGQPAFAAIAFYDLRDIELALSELISAQDRVCLVIYEGDHFDVQRHARSLFVKQRIAVTLLMSDQNLGNRQEAFYGGDTTPGVVALKDLVLGLAPAVNGVIQPAVIGLLLPNTLVTPINSEPFVIAEQLRQALAGRGAWSIQLEISAGMLTVDVGQAPIV
jgi:hypothetical protein